MVNLNLSGTHQAGKYPPLAQRNRILAIVEDVV